MHASSQTKLTGDQLEGTIVLTASSHALRGHKGFVSGLAISPDDRLLQFLLNTSAERWAEIESEPPEDLQSLLD